MLEKILGMDIVTRLFTLFRSFSLSSVTGLIVGISTGGFLFLLQHTLGYMSSLPKSIYFILLPIGGLLTGLIIKYGTSEAEGHGTEAVINAVHHHSGMISLKVVPIKTLATLVTLACGGSAGKEGPCAQIGAALGSYLGKILRLNSNDRIKLVICGISAGFSSVFGTPIAGAIFGIEVLAIGGLRYDVLLSSSISGIISYGVCYFIGINYHYYPMEKYIPISGILFLKVVILGILCGFISWGFIKMLNGLHLFFNNIAEKYRLWSPLRPAIGGLILSIIILLLPIDYLGLSLPLLDQALKGDNINAVSFLWKMIFVSITLASGFSGGIITPLFVIGATAGNILSQFLHIDPSLGASIGLLAVLASATNTPIASIIMGFELFNPIITIYGVIAIVIAYLIVGHQSVYPKQKLITPKYNDQTFL